MAGVTPRSGTLARCGPRPCRPFAREVRTCRHLQVWERHRDESRRLPEEAYRTDRFRAIHGHVTDGDARPIPGATVRCCRVEALLGLDGHDPLSSSKWSLPTLAEVSTDADGAYQFPHLPVGAYTFFYSAAGLSPAIKELVLVQDGLGRRLTSPSAEPGTLRVLPDRPVAARTRLHLVPHRWWPVSPTAVIESAGGPVEFTGLGGPLSKGLIAAATIEDTSPWRVVGRYDLDESSEVRLDVSTSPTSPPGLPESVAFEPWSDFTSSSVRSFYTAISPIPLFWPVADGNASTPSAPANPQVSATPAAAVHTGDLRGFGPQPFLPVLVESRTAWPDWVDERGLGVRVPGPPGRSLSDPSPRPLR